MRPFVALTLPAGVPAQAMREVFGAMLIEKVQPHHVRTYMDLRGQTAKARANREKALLSHVFNKAREWG